MNILLLSVQNIRYEKHNKNHNGTEEPGLAAIAAYLQGKGNKVLIRQINNDINYYEIIDQFLPQIIGISTYDRFFNYEMEVAESIKKRYTDIFMCLGGYTVSYHGYEIMEKFKFIDFIIKGEGEIAFEKLTKSIETKGGFENINGLIYRKDNSIIENSRPAVVEDLNVLPFANRDILHNSDINLVQLSTSRGCTGHCSFCCSFDFWKCEQGKRVYRRMDAKRVVDEMEYIVKNTNKTRFILTDNSYEDPNNDLTRQREIAEEIIKRKLCVGYCVSYKTNFYKHCTVELMNLLIESGLYSIFIGFEAGNSEDLKLYQKACTVEDNDKAVEYYNKFDNLNIVLGYINFNAYSTVDKLKANLDFLTRHGFACDLSYFTSKLTPYKGTDIYDRLLKDGLLTGNIYHGGYGYIYINKEIKLLEDFIFKVTRKYKVLTDTRYICSTLPCILSQLVNEARFHNNIVAADKITLMRKRYKEELNILNSKMSGWLNELINLLERGWSSSEATDVTENYLNEKNIINELNKLKIMRNKLYVDLIKIDPKYKEKI